MSVKKFVTMPTINKKKYNSPQSIERKQQRQRMYQRTEWQKLRVAYLQKHPICEKCEKEGKTTSAEHVHHIKSFMLENEEMKQLDLLQNWNNLMALCHQCHNKIHNDMLHK